ncbi:hypothetical protein M413DRAFT_28447 [Hebeloma cylindrosporum]|uniref:Phytase-like domain-containing protein n=1 Tax=Hebeloma cylindrosporum TaxID=76867 RepID=A0A0C2XSI0_HEBCY|nr:hypothetical protein M413DRAFT_28447 [Hebeloma cylindrosporum h7]
MKKFCAFALLFLGGTLLVRAFPCSDVSKGDSNSPSPEFHPRSMFQNFPALNIVINPNGTAGVIPNGTFPTPIIPGNRPEPPSPPTGNRPEPRPPSIPGNRTEPIFPPTGNRPEPRPPSIPPNRPDPLFPPLGNRSEPRAFPSIPGNRSAPQPFPDITVNSSEPRPLPGVPGNRSDPQPFPTIPGNRSEPFPGISVNRSEPFPGIPVNRTEPQPLPFPGIPIPGNRSEPRPTLGNRSDSDSILFSRREVSLTWDLPGQNLEETGDESGAGLQLRTRSFAGDPKFVAWVSEFGDAVFTELFDIVNQSGQTIRPEPGSVVPPFGFGNTTVHDNRTIFLFITDYNLIQLSPANISLLNDHIVAGPALYEVS